MQMQYGHMGRHQKAVASELKSIWDCTVSASASVAVIRSDYEFL